MVIHELNGMAVRTVADFRKAIQEGADQRYFTIKAVDTRASMSENLFVVLPFEKLLREYVVLAQQYRYPISETVRALLELRN